MGSTFFFGEIKRKVMHARRGGKKLTYLCAEDSACTVCQDQNPPQFPCKRALEQSGKDGGALPTWEELVR